MHRFQCLNRKARPHGIFFVGEVPSGAAEVLENEQSLEEVQDAARVKELLWVEEDLDALIENPATREPTRNALKEQRERTSTERRLIFRLNLAMQPLERGLNEMIGRKEGGWKAGDNLRLEVVLDAADRFRETFKKTTGDFKYPKKRFETFYNERVLKDLADLEQGFEQSPLKERLRQMLGIEAAPLPPKQSPPSPEGEPSPEVPVRKVENLAQVKVVSDVLKEDPERLNDAKRWLQEAIYEVRETVMPALKKITRPTPEQKRGIIVLDRLVANQFANASTLIPLMVKESSLDPEQGREHPTERGRGLFQIFPIAEQDIKNDFGYKATDIFDPVQNTTLGLLYWAKVQHHFAVQPVYNGVPAGEKKLLFLALYNKGYTNVKTLFEATGAQTYGQLEEKLSQAVCDQLKVAAVPAKKRVMDPTLGIEYWEYAAVTAVLDPANKKRVGETLVIGSVTTKLTLAQAAEMLRYARTIDAMDALQLQESKVVISERPVFKPTQVVMGQKGLDGKKRMMWSFADELMKTAASYGFKEFDVSADKDHALRTQNREMLMEMILDYNREVLEVTWTSMDQIKEGQTLWIPGTGYIKKWLDRALEEGKTKEAIAVVEEPVEVSEGAEVPGGRRAYVDPKLEKAGRVLLTNKYKLELDPVSSPSRPSPNQVYKNPVGWSDRGRAKRAKTTHIILHSTNTPSPDYGADDVFRNGKAHYFVSKEGVIYQVRNPGDKMDHAGKVGNKKGSEAKWDGNGRITFDALGIEVAARVGEEYNAAQYEAVKRLVHVLGDKYDIPARNVITHSQVTCGHTKSGFYRVTKPDPLNVHWDKLDLPNNYQLIDYDVAVKGMQANLDAPKNDPNFRNARLQYMLSGRIKSVTLLKDDPEFRKQVKGIETVSTAEWRRQVRATKGVNIVTYNIKKKDTLIKIAEAHNTTVTAIVEFDESLKSARQTLVPNQKIEVPKNYRPR